MKNKPYIIAEIASAHEGDVSILKQLIDQSVSSNANAVKLQIFNRDYLISKKNSLFAEFGEIEFNHDVWKKILFEVSNIDIDLIIEPYDIESINLLKKIDIDVHLKSPASNISNKYYLKKLCERSKKIFLAVGGATISEVELAIEYIQKLKHNNEIILMCGFQNFPTKIEDSNLLQINFLKERFNLDIGYADHTNADDPYMRDLIPIMAISSGANIIEKHITLDRSKKGRDYYSSLNPSEFKIFVKKINELHCIYGNPLTMGKTKAEEDYRKFSKRYAVANNKIEKDTICSADLFSFKRTGQVGITENEFKKYIGKKIINNLNLEDQLFEDNFE